MAASSASVLVDIQVKEPFFPLAAAALPFGVESPESGHGSGGAPTLCVV